MNEEHRIEFVVATDAASIRKIGQYPSVADLSFPELKEYKKVLTKEDMSEMRRAIGLHAQGIGIGSYAYLRRILERVIDKAKDKTVADGKIVPEEYSRKKVAERIKMLGDYLPDVLVSNTTVYGIISKGIHELSEDECIRYFPVLKECIMMRYLIVQMEASIKNHVDTMIFYTAICFGAKANSFDGRCKFEICIASSR